MSNQDYVRTSIEVNLFFQRIMKEHLFLLQTNLQPAAGKYIEWAAGLKKEFERLLCQTITFADRNLPEQSLRANEFVTLYTLRAEEATARLTGACIDTGITLREKALTAGTGDWGDPCLPEAVDKLNHASLCLVQETILFQKNLIALASGCKLFLPLYPLMLDHDTREAEHYFELLKELLNHHSPDKIYCDDLSFWNTIMKEHAQFIDGMLDPTEVSLKQTAAALAAQFEILVRESISCADSRLLQNSRASTEEIIDFKTSSVEGLLACRISSVIPPLLADHVLREANHYLRLLTMDGC